MLVATGSPANVCGASDAPATQPASVSYPPQHKLDGFRWFAPPRVHSDIAVFRVEAPLAFSPEDPDGRTPLGGAVTVGEGDGSRTGEVAFKVTGIHRKDDKIIPLIGGVAKVDVSKLPDGAYPVTLTLRGGPGQPAPKAPAPKTIRIIHQRFAAVAEPHREELGTWLEDDGMQRLIWGKLPTWTNLDRALDQPEDPYAGLSGFMVRAYRNEQLGRMQPYTLYVPEAIAAAADRSPSPREESGEGALPTGPATQGALPPPAPPGGRGAETDVYPDGVPLMILLHGSGGDYRNLVADHAAGQRFDEHPMLIANAGAFYHQEFRHLALNDVLGVLEDVSSKYRVDPRRVYLQGISLGGRGVLELAALMPDRFAAVSAQGVYGLQRRAMDPLTVARLDPVAGSLLARQDIRTWLPNLGSTGVEVVYGHRDEATPPVHGLAAIGVLKDLGYEPVGRPLDTGHNMTLPDYDWADTRAWMLEHRKPAAGGVEEVRLRVANLRFNRHAWVEVLALHDYAGVGEVHAAVVEDDERVRVRVRTTNVAAVRLDPPRGPVFVNGDKVADGGGAVTVTIDTDGAATAAGGAATQADGPRKRPGLSGPLWDAWSSPVLYVFPRTPRRGDGDTANNRLYETAAASAEIDAAFGPSRLPIASADRVGNRRATHNLVIVTSGDAPNPLLAEALEADPARLGPPHDWLPADLDADIAARAGLRVFLRPSPWAADRYVVIVENNTGFPVSLHQLGWWDAGLRGDWVLARSVPDERRGRPRLEVLATGVYGGDWRPGRWTREPVSGGGIFGR